MVVSSGISVNTDLMENISSVHNYINLNLNLGVYPKQRFLNNCINLTVIGFNNTFNLWFQSCFVIKLYNLI